METQLFKWLHGRSFANHRINILMYDTALYILSIIINKPHTLEIRYDSTTRPHHLLLLWEYHDRTACIAIYHNGKMVVRYHDRQYIMVDTNNTLLNEFDEYLTMSERYANPKS